MYGKQARCSVLQDIRHVSKIECGMVTSGTHTFSETWNVGHDYYDYHPDDAQFMYTWVWSLNICGNLSLGNITVCDQQCVFHCLFDCA